jgi:hypothetical protein
MRKSIPIVYIAGAFRGPTNAAVQRNIDVAAWFRAPIAELGAFPLCVHIAEGLAMHDVQQENGGDFWLAATMEVLEGCDAAVLVPGWNASVGTYWEVERALELGLPVFRANFTDAYALVPGSPVTWSRVIGLRGEPGRAWAEVEDSGEANFFNWVAVSK